MLANGSQTATDITAADGVGVIALILVVAFAIDRIAVALMFSLSFIPAWRSAFPDPRRLEDPDEQFQAARRRQFIYYLLASILAVNVLVRFDEVRVLGGMLSLEVDKWLDFVITGVALVGGADRIAAILKAPGTPGHEEASTRPVEVRGTLQLDSDENADQEEPAKKTTT